MDQKTVQKFIDIDTILKSRSARFYSIVPKCIPRYLKRIVHQEDINGLLERYGHLKGKEFVRACLDDMSIAYKVVGHENLPSGGRYIFASNHPLGGLDGLVFIDELGKKYEDIRLIVNDLLSYIQNLDNIFLPVNKHGRQSSDYARDIEAAYASDAQMLTFPAGLCSRKHKGIIKDLEWKKHLIVKAIQYERDIVPVHFSGKNSGFFYRLANFRKSIGIRFNIEMVYLPDEMFRQKDQQLILTIGRPVSYKILDKRFSTQEWAGKLKEHVYALEKDPLIDFPY